jgi:hypothetical protein
VQLAVLTCKAAWSDQAKIDEALDRLKIMVGADAPSYVVYDCRRMLVFPPTDAKERGKQAAKIVTRLTPIASADPRDVLPSQLLAEAQLVLEDRAGAIQTLLRCVNAEPDAGTLLHDLSICCKKMADPTRQSAVWRPSGR